MKSKSVKSSDTKLLADFYQLATAYQKSQILFTFIELEIAELLDEKSLSADDLANLKKISRLAMERFLNAAVTVELLTRNDDLFANSEMTNALLLRKNELNLVGQTERHRKRSSKAWAKLTEKIQTWNYGDDEKSNPDEIDQGAEAMAEQHNLALRHGFALAEAFDFSAFKRLLDLGGGTGASSIALCQSVSHLRSIVYELPENVAAAGKFIAESSLNDRIETISGDFQKDELPDDFDAALLANFMSVADADANKKLLTQIYEKLPVGGVCILSGWMIDESHLAPPLSVLFCLEDICWNASDVERDEKIYIEWLENAGFTDVRNETYLAPTKMICGFKR